MTSFDIEEVRKMRRAIQDLRKCTTNLEEARDVKKVDGNKFSGRNTPRVNEWAKDARVVLYFKLNILKYELNPDDKRIYCDGFGYCQECPFDDINCINSLSKQIKFMKEVVEKSKMYSGGL